jgi:hypothetical protein
MTFGQPEDVWLPQLEELLGLDFTNERLVARGSSLVGHEVIAYGLGREDLNGVRGTATDFDRKRGRCVVGFEGQTSSMLVRPANLQRCEDPRPDPLADFLGESEGVGPLVADRLQFDSLGSRLSKQQGRFEPYYCFDPLHKMRCHGLLGVSNKQHMRNQERWWLPGL